MSNMHEAMLDDVAVYALGALAPNEAQRVHDHLASCESCAAEYAALAPAVAAIGMSAEACADPDHGAITVPALLKSRIMRQVRREAGTLGTIPAKPSAVRPLLWPAYLVAAACFAFALFSSLLNLSLMQQLKATQSQTASLARRSNDLARSLVDERTTVADITSDQAERFNIADGQIVRVNHRIYLTLHGMQTPGRGKVYQAWTLPKGGKLMAPSSTFVPDAHGSAIVELPINADTTQAVAVSIEPEGGSKAPTSKPVIVQALN